MIEIRIIGSPAPQGSKKYVGRPGGRGVMVESSKKVAPWRQDVKAEAIKAMEAIEQREPLDGPLEVEMIFTVPKPASAPKTRLTYPDKKPDLSKLIRSTEDALTEAAVWRDDARVVRCHAAKVFPGEDPDALRSPGAVIRVWRVGERGKTEFLKAVKPTAPVESLAVDREMASEDLWS